MAERPEYVAGSRDSDHVHHYAGQSLYHSHPHTGAHGYFEHPEDPTPHARYFVAPDGGNDLTLWREVPGHPDRPVAVLRLCDVSDEVFNIAAQLATNEQPAAQIAGDLVRAEAALTRVRAIADRWKDEASTRGPFDKIFTAGAADLILMALDGVL